MYAKLLHFIKAIKTPQTIVLIKTVFKLCFIYLIWWCVSEGDVLHLVLSTQKVIICEKFYKKNGNALNITWK